MHFSPQPLRRRSTTWNARNLACVFSPWSRPRKYNIGETPWSWSWVVIVGFFLFCSTEHLRTRDTLLNGLLSRLHGVNVWIACSLCNRLSGLLGMAHKAVRSSSSARASQPVHHACETPKYTFLLSTQLHSAAKIECVGSL